MRRCTLLAATVVVLAGTARAGNQPVVGGSAVPPGKWPDAVAVLGPQGSCTGTLIAPDVVLTAGHCARTNPTHVIANTTNYRATAGERAEVTSITAYPDWDLRYDVAAIVLSAPIAGVAPRALGTACSFDGFATTTSVHLVGFGLTDGAGSGGNGQLNEAMAPVLDPDCSGGNGCAEAIAPGGEFVAGGTGTDSCFGDSGGPVYLDTPRGTVVIGAVSRGLDDNPMPCGGGGIYVRTDKVLAWLETTTGRQLATDSCETADDGGEAESAGCAVGGGAGLAPIAGVLALALRRRRRR